MNVLEQIRAKIANFAGCEGETECRLSDEQIRSYVGERLAQLGQRELSADERKLYDRVILRCEFFNQPVFRIFGDLRNDQCIVAVLDAYADLVRAAQAIAAPESNLLDTLKAIDDAFDRRDAAMQGG